MYKIRIENWKPVKGFEGLYEVSDQGRVRSLRRNIILKPNNVKGYMQLDLRKDGKRNMLYVHQIVAMTFLDYSLDDDLEVDHIDFDKANNKLDNLQILTHRENSLRYFEKTIDERATDYVGVNIEKRTGKYFAKIFVDGKQKNLGTFDTAEEAQEAYLEASKKALDAEIKRYRKIVLR